MQTATLQEYPTSSPLNLEKSIVKNLLLAASLLLLSCVPDHDMPLGPAAKMAQGGDAMSSSCWKIQWDCGADEWTDPPDVAWTLFYKDVLFRLHDQQFVVKMRNEDGHHVTYRYISSREL